MNSKRYTLVISENCLQTGRLIQVWGIKPQSICLNSVTVARVLAGLRWCLARLWKGVYDGIDECVGRAIYDSSQNLGLVKGRMCLLLKSAATSWFTLALRWRCAGHFPGSLLWLFPSTMLQAPLLLSVWWSWDLLLGLGRVHVCWFFSGTEEFSSELIWTIRFQAEVWISACSWFS